MPDLIHLNESAIKVIVTVGAVAFGVIRIKGFWEEWKTDNDKLDQATGPDAFLSLTWRRKLHIWSGVLEASEIVLALFGLTWLFWVDPPWSARWFFFCALIGVFLLYYRFKRFKMPRR